MRLESEHTSWRELTEPPGDSVGEEAVLIRALSAPGSRPVVRLMCAGPGHRRAQRPGEIWIAGTQLVVVRLLGVYGPGYGVRARIARELGVSASTITNDIRSVVEVHRHPCSTCSTLIHDRDWERIARRRAVDVDPLSADGQAEIRALRAGQDALPRLLTDLGFFVDGETISHPDIPAVEEREVTVERLVGQVCAEAFR